ncbi:MAG: hypothetical protein ACYTGP_08480, partial [Planctomycetota bacterium]
MNHWNPSSRLEVAIAALGGRPDDAPADADAPWSLPDDLAAVYRCVDRAMLEGFGEAGLVELAAPGEVIPWTGDGLVRREDLEEAWRDAEFLRIGWTCFGDELLYCLSDAPVGRGAIAVTDHEDDVALKVLGECLADWLARLAAFDGVELAVAPGDVEEYPPDVALAFARDHRRLNPRVEWAARIIHGAEAPDDERLLYWDERELRLRPIEEMTWLEHVELREPHVRDLEPLRPLTRLQWLAIDGGRVEDLAALADLSAL